MSAALRSPLPSLTLLEYVQQYPRRLRLGPAIRLLGRLLGVSDPLGGGDLDRAAVRLRNCRARTPAVAEVDAVCRHDDGTFDVFTTVLNLFGALGTLPHADARPLLSDAVDPVLRDEWDRLTHRLVTVWYRAWLTSQPDAPAVARAASDWAGVPEGVGMPAAASAGLFARARSAAGLEALLARRFDLPVRVEPCGGGWVEMVPDAGPPHLSYDVRRSCQLVLGPVDAARFQRLLPGGGELGGLLRLARSYAGPVPVFEIKLILRRDDVRAAVCEAGRRLEVGIALPLEGGNAREATTFLDEAICLAAEQADSAN